MLKQNSARLSPKKAGHSKPLRAVPDYAKSIQAVCKHIGERIAATINTFQQEQSAPHNKTIPHEPELFPPDLTAECMHKAQKNVQGDPELLSVLWKALRAVCWYAKPQETDPIQACLKNTPFQDVLELSGAIADVESTDIESRLTLPNGFLSSESLEDGGRTLLRAYHQVLLQTDLLSTAELGALDPPQPLSPRRTTQAYDDDNGGPFSERIRFHQLRTRLHLQTQLHAMIESADHPYFLHAGLPTLEEMELWMNMAAGKSRQPPGNDPKFSLTARVQEYQRKAKVLDRQLVLQRHVAVYLEWLKSALDVPPRREGINNIAAEEEHAATMTPPESVQLLDDTLYCLPRRLVNRRVQQHYQLVPLNKRI